MFNGIVDLYNLVRSFKIVDKVWGREIILANNSKYCAKILEIYPGFQCSYHFHKVKTETFIVLRGPVEFEYRLGNESYEEKLTPADVRHIIPYMAHRFGLKVSETPDSQNSSMILEISTFHSDEDVERLSESRKYEHNS